MNRTEALINRLAQDAAPVARVWSPWARSVGFLVFAAGLLGVWGLVHGPRPDLDAKLHDAMFRACLEGSLATGITATLAALMLALPDRSRLWVLLPVPPGILWLGSVSYGTLMDWVVMTPEGWRAGMAVTTFTTLIIGSVPLSAAMFRLLRHAGRLRPSLALAAAGLAVSAFTAAAISVLHRFDASLLVLAWNLGMTAVVMLIETWLGARLLQIYDDASRWE